MHVHGSRDELHLRTQARLIAVSLGLLLMLVACGEGAGTTASTTEGGAAGTSEPQDGSESPGEPVNLTMGTPPSTSGYYTYGIALVEDIIQAYPEFSITTQETGGGAEQANLQVARELDLSFATSATTLPAYNGTGDFEGNADEELRLLWWMDRSIEMTIARVDAGLEGFSDLEGQPYTPGGNGTGTEATMLQVLAVLELEPELAQSALNDAQAALQDGRIVALSKAGSPGDAFIQQVAATTDIELLSMTEQEANAVGEALDSADAVELPAGSFDFQEEPVWALASHIGLQADTRTSQEIGHKLFSAMWEDHENSSWATATPAYADTNVPELTLSVEGVPLHAGTVQWLVENGHDVPESLIPPEYEPVS